MKFLYKTAAIALIISLSLTSCTTMTGKDINASKALSQKGSMDNALKLCYEAFFSYNKRINNPIYLKENFNKLKSESGDIWNEYQEMDHTTFWSSDFKRYTYYLFAPITLGIILLPTSNSKIASYERPSYHDIISTCNQKIGNSNEINLSQRKSLNNLEKELESLERERISDKFGLVGSYDSGVLNFVQQVTWGFIKLEDRKNILMKKDDKVDHFKIDKMTKSHILMSIGDDSNKIYIAIEREANQKYIKGSYLRGKYFIFTDIQELNISPDHSMEILVFKRISE